MLPMAAVIFDREEDRHLDKGAAPPAAIRSVCALRSGILAPTHSLGDLVTGYFEYAAILAQFGEVISTR
jgi:hypothetical protein